MTHKITVSVVMCTYNPNGTWLSEQLASIASQDLLPDELIIQDDLSADSTLQILQTFSRQVPFRVLIEQNKTNQGPTRNFQLAMKRASCDLIFFSDADDVWLNNRISRVLQEYYKNPQLGAVLCDLQLVDESLNSLSKTLWQDIGFSPQLQQRFLKGRSTDALLKQTIGFGASLSIHRRVLKPALPIPDGWGHDNWTLAVAGALFDIELIPVALTLYRQHSSQVSGGQRASLNHRLQQANSTPLAKQLAPRAHSFHSLTHRLEGHAHLASNVVRFRQVLRFSKAKSRHLEIRESFPRNPVLRILSIAPELINGNYHKYSNGLSSMIRDLIFGPY